MSITKIFIFSACASILLAGCGEDKTAKPESLGPETQVARVQDPAQIERGKAIFTANCAVCHGNQAQGADNWRQRGPDGKFPPPPLDGSGHAWHHPKKDLVHMIRFGSPPGQGNMPAWEGKLSDQQIEDVVAYFQSLWPDEVYQAWARIDTGTN